MTAGVRWALFSGSGVSELFADTHMKTSQLLLEDRKRKPGSQTGKHRTPEAENLCR